MARRLWRTDEYRFARDDQGLGTRILLRTAEELVRADPFHRRRRRDVVVAGRPMVIQDNDPLLLWYSTRGPDIAVLELVIDAYNPPAWFTQPAGTWFERFLAGE